MNTKNMTNEQISAFADGELADDQIDAVLAALRTPEGRAAWSNYHQVGDALRSRDMALEMSPDFSERLALRLEQEPAIVAPAPARAADRGGKRFMLQGVAAALAIVVLGFISVPSIVTVLKGQAGGNVPSAIASAGRALPVSSATTMAASREEVLRDPGIDEYLLAHQRFSPSVYSTAQYARSATLAIDSDK